MKKIALSFGALLAISTLALTSCSAVTPDDGKLRIVASTDVYGSIAEAVTGNLATVTSIINDSAQDPHSFEANAQIQLALSKADVVIENGGGYDDFVDTLLNGANNPRAIVLNAVRLFGISADPPGADFNEHVWYDLPTMGAVATSLSEILAALDPANAARYHSNALTFTTALVGLEQRVAELGKRVNGTGVVITEPVPLYLLDAASLVNRTPTEFTEAIEEGSGVPPAVLLATRDLFRSGAIGAFVYNEQTTSAATEQLLTAANDAGVAIVPVTETLPAGRDYLAWMGDNIAALETALQ